MSSKYPKVPTGGRQLVLVVIYLVGFTAINWFVNRDLGLSVDMKRFMNREAATMLMVASILGAIGYLHGKKNKEKADIAAREIAECTEGINRMTKDQKDTSPVANLLQALRDQLADAERARDEASRFDDVVAFVAASALVLVFIATILLVCAA